MIGFRLKARSQNFHNDLRKSMIGRLTVKQTFAFQINSLNTRTGDSTLIKKMRRMNEVIKVNVVNLKF